MTARALSRVLLTAVGVYAFILGVSQGQYVMQGVGMLLGRMPGFSVSPREGALGVLAMIAVPAALFAIAGVLVFNPPRRLLAQEEADRGTIAPPVKAMLSTGLFVVGVLVLAGTAPRITGVMFTYFLTYGRVQGADRAYLDNRMWMDVAGVVVQLAIGIYLLLGAPHLLAWQLRRLGSQDGQAPGEDPQA